MTYLVRESADKVAQRGNAKLIKRELYDGGDGLDGGGANGLEAARVGRIAQHQQAQVLHTESCARESERLTNE